jgi:myo-inositol-1(or 4)-monophosphatase
VNRERAFAERIAREAGAEVLRRYRVSGQEEVAVKGLPRDLVTEADRASEALILEAIRREFPGDAIVAEESAPGEQRRGRVWIVDPLDGTVNFAHGVPLFSVSVGLAVDGVPAAGAVHAPCLGETYSAARGGGATLDGVPIRVSGQGDLSKSLLCTGFAYKRNEVEENNLENFTRMEMAARGVRRLGSAALDLAFTACGRFDGFWELWLSPWDTCAGIVLVREAGGVVTGIGGGADPLFGGSILAAGPALHGVLAEVLTGLPPRG